MKRAILLIPFVAEVEDAAEAEALCDELDKAVRMNYEAQAERDGIEGEAKLAAYPLSTVVLAYVPYEE